MKNERQTNSLKTLKQDIMKTYLTYKNGKKATQANSKKEASDKLGVAINNIHISNVYIDYLKGYEII